MQTTPSAPAAPAPPPPPALPALAPLGQSAVAQSPIADAAPAVAPVAAPAQVAVARTLPGTPRELSGLRRQREELSNQLTSAQRRRSDVARELERARDPAVRAGLEQRLGVLDRRIAQLETDVGETGRMITSAPPALLGRDDPPSRRDSGLDGAILPIVIALVVLQIIQLVRTRGRRAGRPAEDPALRDAAARLARLEHAVDAIAVEVERVSEGQRFVTRLLADARSHQTEQAPALSEYRPN